MNSANISVVISSYNEPERLSACLQALSMQLLPPYEVIVADDASDDPRVSQVADSFGAIFVTHPQRAIHPREGVPVRDMPGTLNPAVERATGDMIATLQQDHIVAPDYLVWLARCFAPDHIMFGLTDHIAKPPDGFIKSMSLSVHLPDEENRYVSYLNGGRSCLVEFTDWRATDGLDSASSRSAWVPLDPGFPPSGHVWMEHMLRSQLIGLRFVVNPFMRLWHWDHPGRDTNMWERDMEDSTAYMQQKHGQNIFSAWILPSLQTVRRQREALLEREGVR